MRIGDVLRNKPSHEVITIRPDAGVRELIALLAEHNVGALIVSADGSTMDGIVSERDVVRHLHHDGTVINNTVSAIMTSDVETCAEDCLVDRIGHDVARDNKEREKRAENPERRLPKQIHLGGN